MIYRGLPERGQYGTIYADPPWKYRNVDTGGSMTSGAARKYPVLGLEKVKAIPIQRAVAKDSVLFLWATTPMLPEAFEVMRVWGYAHKTAIYWHKTGRLGMGFWLRGQVEVCLMGIKGRVKPFRSSQRNIIEAPAGRHSQKPEEMYELIEQCGSPEPRLELFARQERAGWDCVMEGL